MPETQPQPQPPTPPPAPPADLPTALAELERERQGRAADRLAFDEEKAAIRVGLDDEGLRTARLLHRELPDNRPPLPEWLDGMKSGQVPPPRAMSPWFAPPAPPPGAPPAAPPAPGVPPAAPPAPGAPPASAPPPAAPPPRPAAPAGGAAPSAQLPGQDPGYTASRIDEIVARAVRTGDWTEYNEHRSAILRQVTQR